MVNEGKRILEDLKEVELTKRGLMEMEQLSPFLGDADGSFQQVCQIRVAFL
jgi:hypothetical protein